MTIAQEKSREDLLGWVKYFRMVAQDCKHHLRETEYEIAAATVDLIFAKDDFVGADFDAIASCANGIVGREHSDGSGWSAFQHEVSRFFFSFGYDSDWDSITGIFTFWKRKRRFWK